MPHPPPLTTNRSAGLHFALSTMPYTLSIEPPLPLAPSTFLSVFAQLPHPCNPSSPPSPGVRVLAPVPRVTITTENTTPTPRRPSLDVASPIKISRFPPRKKATTNNVPLYRTRAPELPPTGTLDLPVEPLSGGAQRPIVSIYTHILSIYIYVYIYRRTEEGTTKELCSTTTK